MKSYLSLIPISAKVHKRQNRMTLLCIIFAVFLVTAVFSMADMGVRMEKIRLLNKHGSMSLQGLSSNETAHTLYSTAIVLFVLILISGVLMISSSINSIVAQRTKFFGMMRCIGMSKQQIIRFVRLESLNWCKTAVPIGVILGIIITWGLCALLRFVVVEEFSDMPVFGISPIGIISGIVVGVVTVLIAASVPAKRAAKVSSITAVSGNSQNTKNMTYGVNTRFLKIETALGIHHAVSAKKNLILMTSSFALSIILFLSFSVMIEFVNCLMPQSSNASEINILSNKNSNGKITIITSGETFRNLTGVNDYSLVMIQTKKNVTDENVKAIRNVVGGQYKFSDQRDQQTASTYMAFLFFIYGFLAIIALVAVLNIMNSISMSVSARIKQYGAMRAIGMDEHQITKMIAAEAFTYALSGCAVGCIVGLLISKLLYDNLITSHFNYATWSVPIIPLLIIILFVFIAAIAAVYTPSKRIRNISVTEMINEL